MLTNIILKVSFHSLIHIESQMWWEGGSQMLPIPILFYSEVKYDNLWTLKHLLWLKYQTGLFKLFFLAGIKAIVDRNVKKKNPRLLLNRANYIWISNDSKKQEPSTQPIRAIHSNKYLVNGWVPGPEVPPSRAGKDGSVESERSREAWPS